ncbi:uncharacterized protein FTOL_09437 [Fusarium torulosum]|uniref:Uncharacterized protein n=1 Tax=Fusarium torulosum TaxID=33205 RepID=A0AAE8MEC7_9HYPO|nr:uncharacterized protein FTOL_09437 [Fusarium torulosum]
MLNKRVSQIKAGISS